MKRVSIILSAFLLVGAFLPASAEISFKEARRHQDTVSNSRYYFVGITDPGNKVIMNGEQVKVYTIGKDVDKDWFSKEVCGGPHVQHTLQIGDFKIEKEQSSSAGVRRIRATISGGLPLDKN